MKAVALVPVQEANLLAFYQLQMQLLLQLLLKLQEQEAEFMVNLQEICNLKKKRKLACSKKSYSSLFLLQVNVIFIACMSQYRLIT